MNLFGKIIERIYLKQPGNLVYFDSLTGIYSRMYYDHVVKSKYLDKTIFIYFIDINNLKHINDTYGHIAGNKAISQCADQLKRIRGLRDICRVGGDEMIAISDFYIEFTIDGATVGYAEKEPYESISSAVSKADHAMYLNKPTTKKIINIM